MSQINIHYSKKIGQHLTMCKCAEGLVSLGSSPVRVGRGEPEMEAVGGGLL